MKHLKTFLVEKEWDSDNTLSYLHNHDGPKRDKKIAFGYTNLERAKKDVEELNRECGNCPRRAALHTVYRVLPNPIHVRIVTADDTYESKSKIMSREQVGVK